MNNLFKKAHEMTREMVKEYEVDYQAQFGLCLQFLLEDEKEIKNEEDLKQALISEIERIAEASVEVERYSCNKWENYGKKRTYIEMTFFNRGNRRTIKFAIDYTDEDKIYTIDQCRAGSHLFNAISENTYKLVRKNIDNIINF